MVQNIITVSTADMGAGRQAAHLYRYAPSTCARSSEHRQRQGAVQTDGRGIKEWMGVWVDDSIDKKRTLPVACKWGMWPGWGVRELSTFYNASSRNIGRVVIYV
ncbi:MAG: hypothetical protein K8R34_07580 [Methanosarcinales archaeon]|nr:hypothetical protein [Methanosarcinales archaeon]